MKTLIFYILILTGIGTLACSNAHYARNKQGTSIEYSRIANNQPDTTTYLNQMQLILRAQEHTSTQALVK